MINHKWQFITCGESKIIFKVSIVTEKGSTQQVHLCYVGGQITPLQLHLSINCSSRLDVINWAIELTMNFNNFIQHLYQRDVFQIPPQTQMPERWQLFFKDHE